MILWYLDRFGMPGYYRRIWIQLMQKNKLPALKVHTESMHKRIKGTLLTTYGNRKAPTWREDRAQAIEDAIYSDVMNRNPRAIVLSAPEVLCVTGLDPEHATLQKTRGSVYDIHGCPALVMLPLSAWKTEVRSKEIGEANYGESDREAFEDHLAGESDVLNDESSPLPEDNTDAEEDQFFYEPVIVPVGRFMLEADCAKLARIYHRKAGVPFSAY